MATSDTRLANERVFRAANDALQRNREPVRHELLVFLCECSDIDCIEEIELTLDEYRAVRGGDLRFAVARGHQDFEERVLDEFDRYTTVEKPGRDPTGTAPAGG